MVKIFVVTHKENPQLKNELFVPIQVGTNPSISDDIIRDNTLDNIASKNPNYCELTASYWIWKNYSDADYVGLCHYRRYFNFYNPFYNLKPSKQKRITEAEFKKTKLFNTDPKKTSQKIVSILKECDIIMCIPYKLKKSTLTSNYCSEHRKEDWDETKKIILEKFPEYKESIAKYLDDGKLFHMGNIMLCSKKLFNDYHAWIFSILFELEKRITIPNDPYQARVFGFISERLMNMYVYHNNLKIKHVPIYQITDI